MPTPNDRLIELLGDVLELPPESREPFIRALPAEDSALADSLRALMHADASSAGILDLGVEDLAARVGLHDDVGGKEESRIGLSIGPYRLDALIGRGGMGAVYRAVRADGAFAQVAALKLMRSGRIGAGAKARFLLERRILARLGHPHIARLLDGGLSDDGEPWFAMEYVDGEPILHWCRTRRLGIEERIRLLLTLCEAVTFAHGHLVIHRDIKPSNVLVDAQGSPKLLDFGIAKLLGDEDGNAMTQTELRLLTPEYASPEQIRGEPVTIATDVHALGLLLYELLCGRRAFGADGHSAFDTQREVLEREPISMSAAAADGIAELAAEQSSDPVALRRRLGGDLQAIVAKALRKEPEQRYASVAAFADDLRHYLADEPIAARAGARGYRVRKFVRRNRLAVAFAAVIALIFITGVAGIVWQAQRANAQRHIAIEEARHAERESQRAKAVRDFLIDVFKSADPEHALGKPPNAIDLVDTGVKRVASELAGQPQLQAELFDALGVIYADLGKFDVALDTLREARAAAAKELAGDPSLAPRVDLDEARLVADHYEEMDERLVQSAAAPARQRLAAVITAQEDLPQDRRDLIVNALVARGLLEYYANDPKTAEHSLVEAVAQARARGVGAERELAYALTVLGELRQVIGHRVEAAADLREAVDLYSRWFDASNPDAARAMRGLAVTLGQIGHATEAIELMRKVVAAQAQVLGEEHPAYAATLGSLGLLLYRNNDLDEAATTFAHALRVARARTGDASDLVADISNSQALLELKRNNLDDAVVSERRAYQIWSSRHGKDFGAALIAEHNLGVAEFQRANYTDASRAFDDVIARNRAKNSDTYTGALIFRARIERLQDRPQAALTFIAEAMPMALRQSGATGEDTLGLTLLRAQVERDLGDLDAARRDGEAALEGYRKAWPADHPYIREARSLLAQLDLLQNRCDAASGDVLDAQWSAAKVRYARFTPWRVAEAGLLLGLCRRQARTGNDAETKTLIADSAKSVLAAPAADPFLRRLALRERPNR